VTTTNHVAPVPVGAGRSREDEVQARCFDRADLRDLAARAHSIGNAIDSALVDDVATRREILQAVYYFARKTMQVLS